MEAQQTFAVFLPLKNSINYLNSCKRKSVSNACAHMNHPPPSSKEQQVVYTVCFDFHPVESIWQLSLSWSVKVRKGDKKKNHTKQDGEEKICTTTHLIAQGCTCGWRKVLSHFAIIPIYNIFRKKHSNCSHWGHFTLRSVSNDVQ